MKKWVVAMVVGGIMEDPLLRHERHQIIEANSEKEAESIYNEKNNCDYYHGKCIGEITNEESCLRNLAIESMKYEINNIWYNLQLELKRLEESKHGMESNKKAS